MFNNYFTDYARFTLTQKEKLPLKFIMLDIKFQGTKNLQYYVRNFVGAMTSKGIDKDIFHVIVPWTFNKNVMRWYNPINP